MSNDQQNPWGQGSWSGGGRRSASRKLDVDDIIEQASQSARRFFNAPQSPQSSGSRFTRTVLMLGALVVLVVWGLSGLYRVQTGQRGIETVFGVVTNVTMPGLRYNWPAPVGEVYVPEVEQSRRFVIGQVNEDANRVVSSDERPQQSLILTSDENIVDMDYAVFWKVADPVKFIFNVRNQDEMLDTAAQTAMREIIGRTSFDLSVTTGRAQIEVAVQELLQKIVDSYDAGVLIEQVVLQKSDPPAEVIDAFNDVQRARQDRDRMRNEAEAYANSILPHARGQVEKILREAEGYRESLQLEAKGEADRFRVVLDSYKNSPDIVRTRMYFEAMAEVLASSNRLLTSGNTGAGANTGGASSGIAPVVPYLPLPSLGTGTSTVGPRNANARNTTTSSNSSSSSSNVSDNSSGSGQQAPSR